MRYNVLVDGKKINVNPARVSRIPFNMVWQGYQRDIDQTEIAYFVSFDMGKSTEIEVNVLEGQVDEVKIRPLEYGIDYKVCGNTVKITLDVPKKFTVEVNGSAEVLCVFANPVHEFTADENTIYFGPGEHHPGMIYPKAGQTVYLAEGAVVYGGIYAYKANDVTVCGRGVLDSSEIPRGDELTEDDELYKELKALGLTHRDICLVTGFNAYECNNFKAEGIVLRDAPFWTVIIRNGSRGVKLENIKIIGQWRYNADGIDLCASGDILVTDCFVRSFDDSVVVRAVDLDGEYTPCENIVVENNVLWCDWGKNLEIWCGDKNAEVKNITFRNNYLIHCTDIAISIDTWFGAPSLTVDTVSYENIYIDTDAKIMCPCIQENKEHEYPEDARNGKWGDNRRGILIGVGRLGKNLGNQACDFNYDCSDYKICYRNVSFKNVVCNSDKKLPVKVNSKHLCELSGITFENCDMGKYFFN